MALGVWLAGTLFDLDLLGRLTRALTRLRFGEILIPTTIFALFLLADLAKRLRQRRIEREKAKIFEAMITATNHILNNFLNQMKLFKLTAQDYPGFDAEILSMYDQVIDEASAQIAALSGITSIDDMSIRAAILPQPHLRVVARRKASGN